jgi:hypothetical protein
VTSSDPTPETAADCPLSVRQLLKSYDPAQLRWRDPTDPWAIVSAILTRGSAHAREWLAVQMTLEELRRLATDFHGAGLDDPDRARVRTELSLSEAEIPPRPFIGFRWRDSE